jgi:hypothetical protein
MAQEILVSGVGNRRHEDDLQTSLARVRPKVIGIVSAFVSVEGVERTLAVLKHCGQPRCRLVAGTDNAITHPEALKIARDEGWSVRLGHGLAGIFHPKLVVAGQSFGKDGAVRKLSCVYVGSSNLTGGGYRRNVECGFLADTEGCLGDASLAFASFWNSAKLADESALEDYARKFEEKNRKRTVADLEDLGVSDTKPLFSRTPRQLLKEKAPRHGAISLDVAVAAWAGLKSFTGDYQFQPEFPKKVGEIVRRLIGNRIRGDGEVQVYCPDDGQSYETKFKFYSDNSMYRFNVSNEFPGVQWARRHKDGIILVEQNRPDGPAIALSILKPGKAKEVIKRSRGLGTWGRTSTRPYGWF